MSGLISAGFSVTPGAECKAYDYPEHRSAAVSIDGSISLYFADAATAERLAQACLDAAAMLRPADPPATIQRVEDTPSPTADEVTRRLSPWTAAPVLGTAGDLTGEQAAAGVAR